ncbi:DinB family protein [bacterium]|nr:MAG: DinB family protein [bacterium]
MKEQIENAKNDFLRAKGGLLHSLATTPDDRLTWSPSPTARSPLQLAVHAAEGIDFLRSVFDGQTFDVPPVEADLGFRDHERTFTTRQEAIDLIEGRSASYLVWLDGLDAEEFASSPVMPFGMGPVPMALAITFPAFHIHRHLSQLDYVQTVYGDLDWHF